MKRIQFRILLNCTHESMFFRLERGAHLELSYVANREPSPVELRDEDILNDLFHEVNMEHPANYLHRSLSVADVVTLADVDGDGIASNHRSYVVQPFGFQKLTEAILESGPYEGDTIPRNL